MKRQGVSSDVAAAIESVASSGGQLLPPIMGIAAFLMADFLNVSYVRIIQAALIPAILFYVSVMVAVEFVVLKNGWLPDTTEEFDPHVLLEGAHFAVPIGVLVYSLVVMRLSPLTAGLYTVLSLIAVVCLRNLVVDGISVETIRETIARTADGFVTGVTDMTPLVTILATLGIILNLIQQSGLAQKISFQMVQLSGGSLVLLLIFAMLTSILFGLGMPTPAAYVLVVALVAPAMIQFGVEQLVAHMYVFYFALLSAITPPVAVAVAVGTQIADTDFLQASKQALRIGAPGFLIPYVFVANQSLIYWSYPMTPIKTVIVVVAIVGLITALIGYDGIQRIDYPRRGAYFVAAFVGMVGPLPAQLLAVAAIVLPLLWYRFGVGGALNLRSEKAS